VIELLLVALAALLVVLGGALGLAKLVEERLLSWLDDVVARAADE
jgi:hypothetical protein